MTNEEYEESVLDEEVELEEEIEDESEEESEEETTEQPEEKKSLTREEKYDKAMQIANRYAPKEEKASKVVKKAPEQELPTLTREEQILFGTGVFTEEADVEDAQLIVEHQARKGNVITLAEATETSKFKSFKKERDIERKEEESNLPASRGSKTKQKQTLASKGLSTDEHKELAKKQIGL